MDKLKFDDIIIEDFKNKTVLVVLRIGNEIKTLLFFKRDWLNRIKKQKRYYITDVIYINRTLLENLPENNLSMLKEINYRFSINNKIKEFNERWGKYNEENS